MAQVDSRDGVEIVHRSGELIGGMQGFQGSAADVGALANQVGAVATVAREEAELKASIVLARHSPRNEMASFSKIMSACERPSFADASIYSFPRGDTQIEGPSVKLAREMARCWGNLRTGIRIVSMDDKFVHVKGYCYDLETNAYTESEAKFQLLIQRKDKKTRQTQWVKPDERDLRELVNKHGAFCVRNAILQSLPPDFVEDAMAKANETLVKWEAGELQRNPAEKIKIVVMSFRELGVTPEMIVEYLGHPLEAVTAEELKTLRTIYASIRDGNSKREEYFDFGTPKSKAETLVETLRHSREQKQANGTGAEAEGRETPAAPPTGQPSSHSEQNAPKPEPVKQEPKTAPAQAPANTGTVDRTAPAGRRGRATTPAPAQDDPDSLEFGDPEGGAR